jgi:glucose/arabinose dehydrogenase
MRKQRLFVCALLALALGWVWAAPAGAVTVPDGFVQNTIASGLDSPTALAFAPDGRVFVCEKGGALRVIKNGALLATPFLQVTVDTASERGLFGVTLDPDFAANQWIYIHYTATTPTTHNRISRFTADGDVAAAGSEVAILDLDDLEGEVHNGGAIHFGPDGKLYAGVGDNGYGDNAQGMGHLFGKILRLNSDGTIPPDNPFYDTAVGRNRTIWAYGLRNPFTFAFQPGSGRMFIDDVGDASWEEIDDGIAGSNYGWPIAEGNIDCATYRCPLYVYDHLDGRCAITGGVFYNPQTQAFPSAYVGAYFFCDLCAGWIHVFDPATGIAGDFADGISNPVNLAVGPDGLLYYLSIGDGTLNQIATHPSIVSVDAVTDNSAVLHGSAWGPRQASQWQVDLLGADFSAPVVDSGRTTSALSSYEAGGLSGSTTYGSRVRYQDLAGTWSSWSDPEIDANDQFTTLVATPHAPVVIDEVPMDAATGVPVAMAPALSFNVALASDSVTPATVRLVRKTLPQTTVPADLSLDAGQRVLTIAPGELLDPDSKYKIQLVGGRHGIQSRDGGLPGKDFSSLFFTETALASSNPAAGATGVPVSAALQLDFKWTVDAATATTGTIKLQDATSGRRVPLASVVVSGTTVTLTPAAPLKANHAHVLSVAPGASGLRFADGRRIGKKIKVAFRTSP